MTQPTPTPASFITAPPPSTTQQRLTNRWLQCGVLALALGGLFSILLVVSRTPAVQEIIPFKDFFHTALVVHVDLTVLVWFLAIATTLWQWHGGQRIPTMVSKAALGCFITGIVLMTSSAFVGDAHPLMNNYVPVLQHPLFFVSLGFILSAIILQAGSYLLFCTNHTSWHDPVSFTLWSAALITLASMLASLLTEPLIPSYLTGEAYYETIFWSGGHILQFTHTQLLLLLWVSLPLVIGMPQSGTIRNWLRPLAWFGLLAALCGLLPFLWLTSADDQSYINFYTNQMIIGGAIYLVPAAWFLWRSAISYSSKPETLPVYRALMASLVLFGAGGIIALFIREVDVTIPAHYHGSIVGISLCFMALAYVLMPRLGFSPVVGRLANWQAYTYGSGQLLHITGLLISGGYDVARKSTDPVEQLGAQIGMGLMGLGGLIAIIGGLMFVIVMWRSWRTPLAAKNH